MDVLECSVGIRCRDWHTKPSAHACNLALLVSLASCSITQTSEFRHKQPILLPRNTLISPCGSKRTSTYFNVAQSFQDHQPQDQPQGPNHQPLDTSCTAILHVLRMDVTCLVPQMGLPTLSVAEASKEYLQLRCFPPGTFVISTVANSLNGLVLPPTNITFFRASRILKNQDIFCRNPLVDIWLSCIFPPFRTRPSPGPLSLF